MHIHVRCACMLSCGCVAQNGASRGRHDHVPPTQASRLTGDKPKRSEAGNPPPGGKVPALPHTFPQASEFGAAMADLAETGSRGVNSSFTLLWTARRTGKEMSGHSGAPPGPEVLQC